MDPGTVFVTFTFALYGVCAFLACLLALSHNRIGRNWKTHKENSRRQSYQGYVAGWRERGEELCGDMSDEDKADMDRAAKEYVEDLYDLKD